MLRHGIKDLDATTTPILEKHLLNTTCTDLANLVLESQLLLANVQKYDVFEITVLFSFYSLLTEMRY